MTLDPIRAAVRRLYDTTPPPVTVYGATCEKMGA